MSDTETTAEAPAEVTPEDMANRGVGVKIENLEAGSDAEKAVNAFKELVERYNAAKSEEEALKAERNAAIYALKAEHNISFSSLAEVMGVTSSLVLYLYERAQGKTAKQIREESQRSAAAKEQFRETDPNRKPARKQSPAEKELRKQQREQLKAFLAEEKARAEAAGETSEITDEELEEG